MSPRLTLAPVTVVWPRCASCHRFAPLKLVVPEKEAGVIQSTISDDWRFCGLHEEEESDYCNHKRGDEIDHFCDESYDARVRLHTTQCALFAKKFRNRVHTHRTHSTLAMRQLSGRNYSPGLVAHIIALSEQ